ncbi:MAG: GNAT family N-acetyltransferase [Clostridium sartagoforme]|nr:GNAT family N-acetyltransferase [Clostridium sartagoforme]
MIFRKSTKKDLNNIMEIIDEAKIFLKSNKVNQWQNGYPNEEVILRDIENNESYILESNGRTIGTTALSFNGEKTYEKIYEGKWLTNYEYAVIHRIAVTTSSNKRGIGTEIINKVEELCIEKGIRSIKIDTHEDNLIMKKLLLKNKYKYCGIIYLLDGSKRVAFEKVIL